MPNICACCGSASIQNWSSGCGPTIGTPSLRAKRAGAAGVIDVRMGEQDLRDAHAVPLRGLDDALDLAAGVDHRRL